MIFDLNQIFEAAAIKARVGGKVVRFKSPRLEAAMLENLPITRSSINAETVELYTLEPEQVLRELFNRNVPMSDLEVRGGGLEEAFVQITNSQSQNSGTEILASRQSSPQA